MILPKLEPPLLIEVKIRSSFSFSLITVDALLSSMYRLANAWPKSNSSKTYLFVPSIEYTTAIALEFSSIFTSFLIMAFHTPSRRTSSPTARPCRCAGNVTAKDAKHTKRNARDARKEPENPQKTTKETKTQSPPSFASFSSVQNFRALWTLRVMPNELSDRCHEPWRLEQQQRDAAVRRSGSAF